MAQWHSATLFSSIQTLKSGFAIFQASKLIKNCYKKCKKLLSTVATIEREHIFLNCHLSYTEKVYKSYGAMTFSNTIFLNPNIKKWVYHFLNFKINFKNCHKKCKKYFLLLRQLNNILKKLSLIIKGTTEKVHKSYGAMTFSATIFHLSKH